MESPTPASEAPPELPDASKPPPSDTMPKEVSAQTRSHEIAAEGATPDHNEVEPKRQRYVFTEQNGARLYDWLVEHWVSVVAVLSLTFARIFSVRYGIEHGLLPPALRVACRGGLGVALTFAGERLRRIGGSGKGTLRGLLPGTLCAVGVASLF